MKRIEPPRKPVLIDRGIEKILRGPAALRAPSGSTADIAPPVATPRSRLDQLYAESGLDGYMLEKLWVNPDDPAVLTPHVFRDLLLEAIGWMEGQAAAAPEGSAHRTYADAAAVLTAQQERVELLRTYLTALVPG